MPKLIHGPLRETRTRIFDSARWKDYQPRNDDIVIATYAKCGTTWTQRIVSMLILGTAEARNVWGLSPWPDMHAHDPLRPRCAAFRIGRDDDVIVSRLVVLPTSAVENPGASLSQWSTYEFRHRLSPHL